MKTVNQKSILEAYKIEIVGDLFTINDEIETRKRANRKINRSLDNLKDGYNYDAFEGLSEEHLLSMKQENDFYISKLYELKKSISPFKNVSPHLANKFEVGAILYDCWGYEQTNIDFYCIVKVSGDYITILPMSKHTNYDYQSMSSQDRPNEIDFAQDPVRKKVKNYGFDSGFSLRDYAGGGWVSLFKGGYKTSTHYA